MSIFQPPQENLPPEIMEIVLIIALLSALPIIYLILLQKNGKKSSTKSHPPLPGPPGIPVIGNMHQFDSSAPHIYLWELSRKYGPLMSLKHGSLPVLVVSSARMAEEVMKNHDLIFCSRPPMLGQRKLSYNGLDIGLAPYAEQWRELRKICVLHLLSSKRVQSFRPIREDEVYRMIRKISQESASSQVTDLTHTLLSLTCTMICRIGFGKRYDEEGQERKRFHFLMHEAQAVLVAFYFSDYFPTIGWLDKYTGMLSRLEKVFNKLDLFYQELIDEHLDPNRPTSMDGDIIDLLLQLQNDRSTPFDLTVDHIKAMLMNVFLAGSETSAGTVIWAMTALIKNSAALEKAQNEIQEVLGEKKMIDEDDIQKLPYLKAIVKETMRLYPIAPLLLPRYTTESCILDGYEIQPKTTVYVNAWAIGRDPEYWENPHEFLPERFLNITIDATGKHFQLIPFGAGRRGCPGYSLGLATVELALANLLNSFNWGLPSGVKKEDIDTDVLPGLAMLKKNALRLVAKKRVPS
ncbi:6,7,8-trihydroxycoumarin synthase-like [Coffea arabica]|uniref:6,7,8-trihydroxycoumarin synthase-like n=1 Tax=Coffea arabica TaxID=13443 RepID=A0A6P6V7Y8_COFAR|nr:cytochrome P450 71A1-like [Coffea arabica]